MKKYAIPEHELKLWSEELNQRMICNKKLLGITVPKIKLVKMVTVDDLIKEIDTMRDVPLYCKSYEWQDILQELKDKLSQCNPPSESAALKE